jgi:outer membrane protein assembly factor BamB
MAASLDTPSYALIEGALCKLNRRGTVLRRHPPLGTEIEEFLVEGSRIFVLEDGDGFLSGMPNLYCLNAELYQLWIAEMLPGQSAYSGPLSLNGDSLFSTDRRGASNKLDSSTGRLVCLDYA